MPDRRDFLKSLLPAAGALVVAPTLAETMAVSKTKYFFFDMLNPKDFTRPMPSLFAGAQHFVITSVNVNSVESDYDVGDSVSIPGLVAVENQFRDVETICLKT